jgi:hypothetical protein
MEYLWLRMGSGEESGGLVARWALVQGGEFTELRAAAAAAACLVI